MIQVLHASHNGELYKRRVLSADDIADLIRETSVETLTNTAGIDFWFTPSTHRAHRRVNRSATELLLATTRFTASNVPLMRGIVVLAAHDGAGWRERAGGRDSRSGDQARRKEAHHMGDDSTNAATDKPASTPKKPRVRDADKNDNATSTTGQGAPARATTIAGSSTKTPEHASATSPRHAAASSDAPKHAAAA